LDLHSSYAIGTTHFYICQSWVLLDTTLCNTVCRLFSWHSVSSTYKTRHHDISEIMLKVALNIHYMFRIKLHTFTIYNFEQDKCIKLLIFGSVNLNDEENKAVFKSVQTFIIQSKRFTPWHDRIIFFTFSFLFNLFVLIFSSKLCSFQLHAYIYFSLLHCINNSHPYKILISMHIYFCDVCMYFLGNRF